jgi:hypothetical protein
MLCCIVFKANTDQLLLLWSAWPGGAQIAVHYSVWPGVSVTILLAAQGSYWALLFLPEENDLFFLFPLTRNDIKV